MSVMIVRTLTELREHVRRWRKEMQSVSVVPTMGGLHAGHLSLVFAAKERCDRTIVTSFVNPKQFDDQDDLAIYPRTEAADLKLIARADADILYAPRSDEIYQNGFGTNISVSGVSSGLCGSARPGHFDGVATIVTKLFMQSGADVAFFGEKDFQQLHVVRRLVRDLDIPITIVPCPTIRESDGLALSSRNEHLSTQERSRAPLLATSLICSARQIAEGAAPKHVLEEKVHLLLKAGFDYVDYFELRAEDDLSRLDELTAPARLLAAASLGRTRLIDNVAVPLRS